MPISKKTLQIALLALIAGTVMGVAFYFNRPTQALAVSTSPTEVAQVTSAPPGQGTPSGTRPSGTPGSRPNAGGTNPSGTNQAAPTPIPTASAPTTFLIKATGNLASANQATLAFQTGGRVKEIKAKEGDKIKAGTSFVSLDNATALDAAAASASSALDKVKAGPSPDDIAIAKANVDRNKAAVDQAQAAYDRIGGSSNPAIGASAQGLALQQAWINYLQTVAQFNQAVNHPTAQELAAAIATNESAKQAAVGARLIAPFDATVLWVGVRVGESITVGGASAAIADLSHMQVQINVDEISAAAIQVGQAATVSVDAFPDKNFTGHVSKVAFLGTATGNLVTVPITVDIDPSDVAIYPGLSATVQITTNP